MDKTVLSGRQETATQGQDLYRVQNSVLKRSWAIICPGPSLKSYDGYNCDDGCLIAVNQAILDCIPDWWAMIDEGVFNLVASKISLYFWADRTKLFVPKKWDERHKAGQISGAYECFSKIQWTNIAQEAGGLDPTFPWQTKTVYTAVARAINAGATIIRVYGADMCGQGYFMPGIENEGVEHHDKRWEEERINFNRLQQICMKLGIYLIRMVPNDK